jgi:ketosteroid isomerase-like protein
MIPTVRARATTSFSARWGERAISFRFVEDTDHPNAVAYRRTADAFRSGDLGLLASLIDPAVVWHVPGTHAMAGDIRGREALLTWLRQVGRNGFWLTEHDVLGNDQHVCALSVMGARREGVDVQTRVVSVFHYRDGRQVERWFHPEDSVAWDTIFGE